MGGGQRLGYNSSTFASFICNLKSFNYLLVRNLSLGLFSFLLAFFCSSVFSPTTNSSALTCENGTISGGSALSICDTSTTDVNVSITGAWTVSVSSAGTLGLNLTPTSSGVLSTATDNVNVYTNTPNDYQLYLNSTTGNTDIYNEDVLDSNGNLASNLPAGTNTNHFVATSGTKASPATLTNNTWGYTLANLGSNPTQATLASTAFSKVELSSSTADSLISSGSKTTGAGDNLPVTYGFMADTKLTPGTYSTQVTYTAIAETPSYTLTSVSPNELRINDQTAKTITIMTSTPTSELGLGDITASITNGTNTVNLTGCTEITSNGYRGATCTFPGGLAMGYYNVTLTSSWHNATYTLTNGFRIKDYRTLSNFAYMQDIPNSDVCENTPEATSTGANIVTLKDSRDQKQYKIAHLADGNCWMVQNLALDGGRTLTTTDSNVTESHYLRPNISSGTISSLGQDQIFSGFANNYTSNCYGRAYCITNTEPYGNLYNFMAATATIGTEQSTGTITQSVCPLNWRLPDHLGNRSYVNLLETYSIPTVNSDSAGDAVLSMQRSPLFFTFAGLYLFTSSGDYSGWGGLRGDYWTRTVGTNNLIAYVFEFQSNGVFHPDDANNKVHGFSVRCIFGS